MHDEIMIISFLHNVLLKYHRKERFLRLIIFMRSLEEFTGFLSVCLSSLLSVCLSICYIIPRLFFRYFILEKYCLYYYCIAYILVNLNFLIKVMLRKPSQQNLFNTFRILIESFRTWVIMIIAFTLFKMSKYPERSLEFFVIVPVFPYS